MHDICSKVYHNNERESLEFLEKYMGREEVKTVTRQNGHNQNLGQDGPTNFRGHFDI